MKKTSFLLTVVSIGFIFCAFTLKDWNHYILKNGESIRFMGGPKDNIFLYQANASRGSYDKSSYNIKIDSLGQLHVSDLHEAMGKHQQELDIHFCEGSVTKKSDTLFIESESKYQKIYFLTQSKKNILDSLSNKIHIELVAISEDNEPADILVSGRVRFASLPVKTNSQELYKPFHNKNTLAHFSYVLIRDDQGKEIKTSLDDLLLIGGNHLRLHP